MSGFLDRLGRRAVGAETRWHTRPRSRFEPLPAAGAGRAAALPLGDDVLDPPGAQTPVDDLRTPPGTGHPTAERATAERTPAGSGPATPDDDAWHGWGRAEGVAVPDRSGELAATRRSRRQVAGTAPPEDVATASDHAPSAPGRSGRRASGARRGDAGGTSGDRARSAPAARDAVGRGAEGPHEQPTGPDLDAPPLLGHADGPALPAAPAWDAAPAASLVTGGDVAPAPQPVVRATAGDRAAPATRRRTRAAASARPPGADARVPAAPAPTTRPRTGRPDGVELDPRTLVAQHVLPALRAQGVLSAAERVDLRLDGHAGPARDAVGGRPTARPDPTADAPPAVHLHIGTVQVVRPTPAPATPAAPPADPSSDRLATFLAGRRSAP